MSDAREWGECGYSRMVSRAAWYDGVDVPSILISWGQKMAESRGWKCLPGWTAEPSFHEPYNRESLWIDVYGPVEREVTRQ